jgi:hypothetical protein
MNQAFFEYAMKKLEEITPAELRKALEDAGFVVLDKEEDEAGPEPTYKPELRLYAFVNFYLSSIQQGIQTGHASVDIIRKYVHPMAAVEPRHTEMVADWADNYKTYITLNGGRHVDIKKALVLAEKSGFPFAPFHEDEDSLGGLMTAVAVVLPDYIFNLRRKFENGVVRYEWIEPTSGAKYLIQETDELFEFVDFLKSKDLAK